MIELRSNALILVLVLGIPAINNIITVVDVNLCPDTLVLVFVLHISAINGIIVMIDMGFGSNAFASVLVLHLMAIDGVRKSSANTAEGQYSNNGLQFPVQHKNSLN